jgi:hypothetical protein
LFFEQEVLRKRRIDIFALRRSRAALILKKIFPSGDSISFSIPR